MTNDVSKARTSAARQRRALQLVIRGAEAEERVLERRLADVAEGQKQTRRSLEAELREEHFGRLDT
jgi:hypothetical protein